MKIAITANPAVPVPPILYGGIERVVAMLIEGLIQRGHEVIFFGSKESTIQATKRIFKESVPYAAIDFFRNNACFGAAALKGFDLVHCFGRMKNIAVAMPTTLPKIVSYQLPPTISQVKFALQASVKNTLWFTGCSNYISDQIRPYTENVITIYNGFQLNKYTYRAYVKSDAPLIFLGRIEAVKGTHIAIEVAKRANSDLIIAGNITDQSYFDQEIKPHINHTSIKYIGAVNDEQKNYYLGNAKALLMPVQWDEPFGIVMAEALACGTPVIGFNRGSIPEIVQPGINGFISSNIGEMVEAVQLIEQLNRGNCRGIAEQRFSDKAIVDKYECLYKKIIKR